jgi:hypothetical protein
LEEQIRITEMEEIIQAENIVEVPKQNEIAKKDVDDGKIMFMKKI